MSLSVPPSVPVCQVKEKPVLKGNITLACNSNDGKPAPKYKWTKTSPTSEVFFSPALSESIYVRHKNMFTECIHFNLLSNSILCLSTWQFHISTFPQKGKIPNVFQSRLTMYFVEKR